MTPDAQRALPFLKTIETDSMPAALHALAMLGKAVDLFQGEQVCMKVSTITTREDVGTFIGLMVSHEDAEGDHVNVTVQVEKTVHVSEMPLPRTSYDQVVWVRGILERTLEAPTRDPSPVPDELSDIMRAHAMMDEAGACHLRDTEMDTVAATPLGTGGLHVVQDRGMASLRDVDDATTVHGPVEVIVTQRDRPNGRGVSYVVRVAAHCHTTHVPGMDPMERLRWTRRFAERRTMEA